METQTVTRRQALIWTSVGVAGALLAASTPVVTTAAGLAQTTTLQAWINRGAPQSDLIAQQIDKYNAELQQSGSPYQWQYQSIEDIDAKLAAVAAAGTGFPDAYLGDDSLSWVSRYIQAG